MLLKINIKRICLCLLFLLVTNILMSNTKEVCDSLISKGVESFKKRDYIHSLEFFTEARSIANKYKWDRQLYDATFHIGNTYYEMFDYGEALNYFLESYTIALSKLDAKDEIASLNNIANLYTKEKIYDKALEYYTKAYQLAKEKNIDARKGLPVMNIGYIYNKLEKPEKARYYLKESLKYLEEEYLLSAKILLIENDLLLGNSHIARKEAFELLNNPDYSNALNVDVFLWSLISKSYLSENNYEMASEFALKVLDKKPVIDIKKDTYQLLSDIFKKSGNLEKALSYKDSIIDIEKKLNDIKNGRLFENNRVKFEIQNYKEQLIEKEDKIVHERWILYCIITIILVMVLFIIIVLRQKNIVAKRNQENSELNLLREKNNSLILEQKVLNSTKEQERLKNEIDTRNRKLSAKALHLSGRNELIEEILNYLSKRPKYSKDSTLASYVESLKHHIKTDNDWDDFISHFQEVNSGFLTRLKAAHPTLNISEIRFIAYMYMNLSYKEIAHLLNITSDACKKRKERLVSKMELPKDLDLYEYIANL